VLVIILIAYPVRVLVLNMVKAKVVCNGIYKCKMCNKTFVETYTYKAYEKDVAVIVAKILCESVCIRGIARVLKIANNTVLNRIRKVASAIIKPAIPINQLLFEVDELRTYIGEKGNEYWVAYALNKATGKVVDFVERI
jgi:hypothetical protein